MSWWWWCLVGALLVSFVFVVWLIVAHLAKLDDLVHEMNDDLTEAEAEIAELRERLRLPARKPLADTQPYGRHAHRG